MLARRGSFDEAVPLARRSIEGADTTDLFYFRSRCRLVLAEVLALAGERDEPAQLAKEILAIHEAKEDVTGAAGHVLVSSP